MKFIFTLFSLLILTVQTANGESVKTDENSTPSVYGEIERIYQEDADLVRLHDLIYWTGLIEEYKRKVGHYPLAHDVKNSKTIVTVNILTSFQKKNNINSFNNPAFKEKSMHNFVSALDAGLGRGIDEHYDIQKVATTSPIGYHYFVTKDGYVFWVTCISCGVTKISTLLMDGGTPTVNVASSGMVDKVHKAKTREDMLTHPIYKSWLKRPFHKKGYTEQLTNENLHHSKK